MATAILLVALVPLSQALVPGPAAAPTILAYGVPDGGGCDFGELRVTMPFRPGQPGRFQAIVTPGCHLLLAEATAGTRLAVACLPEVPVPCPNVEGAVTSALVLAGAVGDEAEDPFDDEGDPEPCPESILAGVDPDPCRGDFGQAQGTGTTNLDVFCRRSHGYLAHVHTAKTHLYHAQNFQSECIELTSGFNLPAPPQFRFGETICESEKKYRLDPDPALAPPCEVVQDQGSLEGMGAGDFYKHRSNGDHTRYHRLVSVLGLSPNFFCTTDWSGDLPIGNISSDCFFP